MGPIWMGSRSQRTYEAAVQAEDSKMAADDALGRVQELEWKVNKLMLVNHALFELASQRLGITETDLLNKMNEIDLRDGKLDGKEPTQPATVCEECSRTYSRRHNHCLYCGHVNHAGTAF